jgi:iron-sulfur cluster assembly accessory protein
MSNLDDKEIYMQPTVQTDFIKVSPSAIRAIQDLMKERDLKGYALRVFVSGKTCSGYQYGMALDDNFTETDISVDTEGIKVVVDDASLEYLKGAKLDFIDDERGKGFMVDNPNVAASGGCDSDNGCGGGGCCS